VRFPRVRRALIAGCRYLHSRLSLPPLRTVSNSTVFWTRARSLHFTSSVPPGATCGTRPHCRNDKAYLRHSFEITMVFPIRKIRNSIHFILKKPTARLLIDRILEFVAFSHRLGQARSLHFICLALSLIWIYALLPSRPAKSRASFGTIDQLIMMNGAACSRSVTMTAPTTRPTTSTATPWPARRKPAR
jgi:hypothetical protein